MIGHLKGTVIHKNERYLILETGGVGYKIYAPVDAIGLTPENEEASFWIHHVVREDASDLFGFKAKDELDFFELLISISGIGPRTALGILNVTTVASLKRAVISNDTSHLTKVSGIGKKNAEKIVLELKDKFEKEEYDSPENDEMDTIEALKSLGYSQNDARNALKDIPKDITSTQERIKLALKVLNR